MKYIIAALFVAMSIPVVAEETAIEQCTNVSEYAKIAMTIRQSGDSLTEVFESLDSDDTVEPTVAADFKLMLIDAYKADSLYTSRDYKRKAVVAYQDKIMLECLEVVNNG